MVINVFDTARAYQTIQKMPQALSQMSNPEQPMQQQRHINLMSLESLCDKFLNVQLDKFF